jgi:phosphatidylserine decarboxylase
MDLAHLSSRLVGWLADRPLPGFLRAPAWRLFARAVGADLAEVERPLHAYPSLSAFFVRHLRAGSRRVDADPDVLPSPVDGRVQHLMEVGVDGEVLQAKGQPYRVDELLGPLAPASLVGWRCWTLYLSPRDYHRIHCPFDGELVDVAWIGSERHPVAPRVLARRPRVFVRNARAVLRLSERGRTSYMVFVGALNVSRIKVEGVPSGGTPARPLHFVRGQEIGRFELGSTVILVTPPTGPRPLAGLGPESPVHMGAAIGRESATADAT